MNKAGYNFLGGAFLIEEGNIELIFVPENWNEEQLMIKQSLREFVLNDWAKVSDAMENGAVEHNVDLMKTLGELGILGTHISYEYGGSQMDTNTNSLITEMLGETGAFSTTFGAHTGIGMLPFLYFGTEEQKQKYLTKLVSGEKIACYCLTEPGSGSDALAAKTTAVLAQDGEHYKITGQKMWITNAGFADIFIVFAKIDGDKFTAFIVEKDAPGLTLGEEEHKIGIKGSSTRQVFFDNVSVHLSNILGEIGKGHLIAFNVLNTGRFRVGPAVLGGFKVSIDDAVKYANNRIQFGKSIGSFQAIKAKIADSVCRCFATESMVYRISNLLYLYTEQLMAQGKSYGQAKLIAAKEFAIESSIVKVMSSEDLDIGINHTLQIHGGMGYSEETRVARSYRDMRIAQIYEGTSEINRLLIIHQLFKNVMSGKLDIATPALEVQKQNLAGEYYVKKYDDTVLLYRQKNALFNIKRASLMMFGIFGKLSMAGKINFEVDQELSLSLSDLMIEIYRIESSLLRVEKCLIYDEFNDKDYYQAILQLINYRANIKIRNITTDLVANMILPEKQNEYLSIIDKMFTDLPLPNLMNLHQIIADKNLEANGFTMR